MQDIKYSEKERNFYNFLFYNTKNKNSEFIEGPEVASLFMKANVGKV